MSTENEYVATALAEKRLKEVLDSRLGDPAFAARMSDILLAVAEIEYLPRKKAVSIRLRIPETATTAKRTAPGPADRNEESAAPEPVDANGETREQREAGFAWADKEAYDESQLAKAYDRELPHDRGVTAGPTRIGTFETKTGENVPIYDDEFFTE